MSSIELHRRVRAHPLRPPIPVSLHENELRRRYVLVRHDPMRSRLSVLLRFEGAEEHTTRIQLLELGFRPSSSPVVACVSWSRHVSPEDLADLCARLCRALHGATVLDLGASFTDSTLTISASARTAAEYWHGRVLAYVGGTRRAVVFEASCPETELEDAFAAAREHYFDHDFHGASE